VKFLRLRHAAEPDLIVSQVPRSLRPAVQIAVWLDDCFGSRAEELKVSTTGPLYPEKQTLARAASMSH
jgi:hypothetical protein